MFAAAYRQVTSLPLILAALRLAAGMNFVGEDEEQDQMKELHWEHGYQMFWILGSFVTVFILCMLHRKVRFSVPVLRRNLMDLSGRPTLIAVRFLLCFSLAGRAEVAFDLVDERYRHPG